MRSRRGTTKHLFRLLSIAVLFCLIVSCTHPEQREANNGLDASVAQLPELRDFDVVKVVYQESSQSAYETICYYATAHVIIGSPLAESEAMDIYVEKLQSLGWGSGERQYETTRALTHGMHERIVVRTGEPGVDVKDAVDYVQLGKTYPTIIFVRLVFIMPSRDEC